MKTALVVDDDELIRKMVRHALEKRGWDVLEAVDGVDGVARVMLHTFDAIITDISMPKSDGLEMISILKETGALKGVRLVIMSGIAALLKAGLVEKTGAVAVIEKPFSLSDLYSAVGEKYDAPD